MEKKKIIVETDNLSGTLIKENEILISHDSGIQIFLFNKKLIKKSLEILKDERYNEIIFNFFNEETNCKSNRNPMFIYKRKDYLSLIKIWKDAMIDREEYEMMDCLLKAEKEISKQTN